MKMMTREEKALFCEQTACLFSPPDEEMIDQVLEKEGPLFFDGAVRDTGGDDDFLKNFLVEGERAIVLEELKRSYGALFSQGEGGTLSLVESYYKPWSLDRRSSLPFAKDRGLLMGDPALHVLALYRECGLELPEEFRGCPDHIALELEFLSYLYRWMGDREVGRFVHDHLDWVPLLREGCEKGDTHPFYRALIELVDLFLKNERKRLEKA
jgi:putative dimethyl sulfoxide reductase chaperone